MSIPELTTKYLTQTKKDRTAKKLFPRLTVGLRNPVSEEVVNSLRSIGPNSALSFAVVFSGAYPGDRNLIVSPLEVISNYVTVMGDLFTPEDGSEFLGLLVQAGLYQYTLNYPQFMGPYYFLEVISMVTNPRHDTLQNLLVNNPDLPITIRESLSVNNPQRQVDYSQILPLLNPTQISMLINEAITYSMDVGDMAPLNRLYELGVQFPRDLIYNIRERNKDLEDDFSPDHIDWVDAWLSEHVV